MMGNGNGGPKPMLSDKVRDSVTGFEGTATARSEYLNGCVRFQVERLANGEVQEWWFDAERLTVMATGTREAARRGEAPGGARPAPPRTGGR